MIKNISRQFISVFKILLSSINSAHAQEIEINFMSCLDLGECSRKGWWKDKFGDVNGQTPLEFIFFSFF